MALGPVFSFDDSAQLPPGLAQKKRRAVLFMRQLALYDTRQPLVLSLRPVSRSLPALSSAVLPLAAGLSVWDVMENEVDLWEI